MTSHVLVPVDGSEQSTDALEFALEEHSEARITALYVIDPADFHAATTGEVRGMADYEQLREDHEAKVEEILEGARDQAATHGVEIETDDVVGSVSDSIIDYADENGVDHIVIGSHGRTGASRILLGSVAEMVARRSPVPVTIVR